MNCLFAMEELVDAPLLSDLSAELLGLEAESWSLAVSPEFCSKYDKHTVKRQDIIYGETISATSSSCLRVRPSLPLPLPVCV